MIFSLNVGHMCDTFYNIFMYRIIIILICLLSVNAKAEETNYFCTDEFRKNYSLKLLKEKIKEGYINENCTTYRDNALPIIISLIKKPEALKVLENAGANFNWKSEYGKYTLMHIAAWGNLTETIPFLMSKGIDINQKDKAGNIPVQNACSSNKLEILDVFLKNSANYKYVDTSRINDVNTCLTDAVASKPNYDFLKKVYSLDVEKKI